MFETITIYRVTSVNGSARIDLKRVRIGGEHLGVAFSYKTIIPFSSKF